MRHYQDSKHYSLEKMKEVEVYVLRAQSESLLSELEPLELLLPVSEELLLPLSRDGPPPGAEPAFSAGYKRWRLE